MINQAELEKIVQRGIERAARAKESGMSQEEFEKNEAEKALLKGAASLFDNYGRGYEEVHAFDENENKE